MNTQRLKLIPFEIQQVQELHHIFTQPYVRKYLWDDQTISMDQTQEILETNKKYFEESSWGLWQIRLLKDNSLIGFVGLWPFFEETQPQLLYGLLPEYSKFGYATEASRCILNYAKKDLGYSYLLGATDKPHLNSQKVMERLGMSYLEERIENGKSTLFFKIIFH